MRSSGGALVVPSHTFVPYNAQALIHTHRALFALLQTVTVSGRVSEVWRLYFSQRIFRDHGTIMVDDAVIMHVFVL